MKHVVALLIVCSAVLAWAAEKPRIFITDSKSWEMSGGGGGTSGGFGGASSGGARPQTAEIIKTFGERCPNAIINNKQEKADYVVVLDHEGGKGLILHDNKVAVFKRSGDAIFSHSTRSLGNSVKDSCDAIMKDWWARGSQREPDETAENKSVRIAETVSQADAEITSEPAGADIEIDGAYVGSTPSRITLATGQHTISIRRSAYKTWERKINVSGGRVNIAAALEAEAK
ncbi:MAG TPA: PEGA domain-containing protein [Terriglobales bacterium]|jgi:PEGA domain|nr:PEGA domain-containing protein [Terriglobales bacterium]